MKQLIARKCEDGWLVEVIDSYNVSTESDVQKLIRENGLQRRIMISNERIYAD